VYKIKYIIITIIYEAALYQWHNNYFEGVYDQTFIKMHRDVAKVYHS